MKNTLRNNKWVIVLAVATLLGILLIGILISKNNQRSPAVGESHPRKGMCDD